MFYRNDEIPMRLEQMPVKLSCRESTITEEAAAVATKQLPNHFGVAQLNEVPVDDQVLQGGILDRSMQVQALLQQRLRDLPGDEHFDQATAGLTGQLTKSRADMSLRHSPSLGTAKAIISWQDIIKKQSTFGKTLLDEVSMLLEEVLSQIGASIVVGSTKSALGGEPGKVGFDQVVRKSARLQGQLHILWNLLDLLGQGVIKTRA